MIDLSDIQKLVEDCFNELSAASRSKYDSEKADRTAALFLSAQFKISLIIEEVEMRARSAKNEISRIEGEKYFDFKSSNQGKTTEALITNHIAKDADVLAVKTECAKSEAELKKWTFVLNALKDGHIFFRNLSKNKSWAE